MAHVKRFDEINENFYFNDWVDLDTLQKCIDNMKPTKTNDAEAFKTSLKDFNDNYDCVQQKRLPAAFGKQVADWVDLYLVQDIIDRMNPNLCQDSEQYKQDLKNFVK